MKKLLFITAAALCTTLQGYAQVSTYTPGTLEEGVIYYLPKTSVEVEVVATQVSYTPGEFCQYANRYLQLKNISDQKEVHWELKSIRVNNVGIPDKDKAFGIKLKDKSAASQVELTEDGIVKAINTTAPAIEAPKALDLQKKQKHVDPRSFMTEEILSSASTAKMAELVAKEIYNIRESKNSLTRGQADYMPQDGAALKLMLDNLTTQEKAMTEMFAGQIDKEDKVFRFTFIPEEKNDKKVAFRFSKKLGILPAENLAGEPIYFTIENKQTLPEADEEGKAKKKMEGVIYNIPGQGTVSLFTAQKVYVKKEMPITQFGETEVLTENLFNKKINTRVVFDPNTGGILKIDKDN